MSKTMYFGWPAAVPCLPLLLILVITVAPALSAYAFDASLYLTTLIMTPALLLIYGSTSKFTRDISITAAGLAAVFGATVAFDSQLTVRQATAKSYVMVQGLIENVHYHNKSLSWDDSGQSTIKLKVTKIYLGDRWVKCSGKIHLKDKTNNYQYGDSIVAEGALFSYQFNNDDKVFSYGLHLKYEKISHWMRVDKIHKLKPAAGYRKALKALYDLRDKIITRAGQGLPREADRKLLASMFFGYKGLLSADEKEIFKRSGTIHLFAVSGLHVGIAAFFILSLLKLLQLPLKVQSLTLVFLLLVYVVMTGAPASAVRALVMISVWSIAKGYMLPSSGLNNICFSAFVLILANPLNLLSAGFYYTFIITTFLVVSYTKSLGIFLNLMEKKLWLGTSGWNKGWVLKVYLLVTCSLSASVASFGLNLLINEKVIPLAFLANVAVSALASSSFILAVVSLSGFSLFYQLQAVVLSAIRFIASEAEFAWTSTAPICLIVLLYGVLFSLLYCTRARIFYPLFSGLLALMIILGWPSQNNRIDITVPSSSNIPTIMLKHEGRTFLINCSSVKVIPELFHEKIDQLILPDIRADHIRFLGKILQNCQVKEILIFRKPTAFFKRTLQKESQSHLVKVNTNNSVVQALQTKQDYYELVFCDNAPAKSIVTVVVSRQLLGKTTVKVEVKTPDHSGLSQTFNFFYSNTGYHESLSF